VKLCGLPLRWQKERKGKAKPSDRDSTMKGVLSLRLFTLPPHGPQKKGCAGHAVTVKAVKGLTPILFGQTRNKKTIVEVVIDRALS